MSWTNRFYPRMTNHLKKMRSCLVLCLIFFKTRNFATCKSPGKSHGSFLMCQYQHCFLFKRSHRHVPLLFCLFRAVHVHRILQSKERSLPQGVYYLKFNTGEAIGGGGKGERVHVDCTFACLYRGRGKVKMCCLFASLPILGSLIQK